MRLPNPKRFSKESILLESYQKEFEIMQLKKFNHLKDLEDTHIIA